MKNSKSFINAYTFFNEVKFNEAQELLERITKNFNLTDDEFHFEIRAFLYQPHLEIATALANKGQAHLIAEKEEDRIFVKHQWEIKTRIDVTSKTKQKINRICSIRIDDEGQIAAVTSCQVNQMQAKEAVKIVKKWLKKEFGACNDI